MNNKSKSLELQGEGGMLAFGAKLAATLEPGLVIYLQGNLGAGKTTLCRGILQGLGFEGRVKSPTYTLVESYEIAGWKLFHFDLYRLAEPEELEYLGARDYFEKDNVCLVEWPEKARGFLSGGDLVIEISGDGKSRRLLLQANTDKGYQVIKQL